jgi:hypothetical protein
MLSTIRKAASVAAKFRLRSARKPLFRSASTIKSPQIVSRFVGELRVLAVDADYFAIMRAPHAERIARELTTLLDGAGQAAARPEATVDVD